LDIYANPEPGADSFKSTDAYAIPVAIHLLTEVVQGSRTRMKYDSMLLSRVIRAWRRRSVGGFSRLLIYNLGLMATGKYSEINHPSDQSFDRVYNVESAGTEEPKFLTAEEALKAHAKGYEPTTKEQIEALLGMLPRLDLTDFIFVDFGSGKGRALFVAAEHPFRQIIGVEYSRELH